jgi:hypothetical protein
VQRTLAERVALAIWQLRGDDLNGMTDILNVPCSAAQRGGFGTAVDSIERERCWLVPNRVMKRNPCPKFPIGRMIEAFVESANGGDGFGTQHHSRECYLLPHSAFTPEFRDNARPRSQGEVQRSPHPSFVDIQCPAKRGADRWFCLERQPKRSIETLPDSVIAVENVDQAPLGECETSVECCGGAEVMLVSNEPNPVCTHLANDGRRIVARRTVIDDRDLHLLGTGILNENTGKGFAQVVGTVVSWDHY